MFPEGFSREGCLQKDLLFAFHSLLRTEESIWHGAKIIEIGERMNERPLRLLLCPDFSHNHLYSTYFYSWENQKPSLCLRNRPLWQPMIWFWWSDQASSSMVENLTVSLREALGLMLIIEMRSWRPMFIFLRMHLYLISFNGLKRTAIQSTSGQWSSRK